MISIIDYACTVVLGTGYVDCTNYGNKGTTVLHVSAVKQPVVFIYGKSIVLSLKI